MAKTFAIIAAFFVGLITLGYFLTAVGGKPLSTDLSDIGQGRPALVLAYENFSPSGGEALNQLRKVRSDYESRLDFVVADLGTPQGRSFASRYQLVDGQAVFMSQDGRPLLTTRISADEGELRSRLEAKLAAVE